MYWSELKEWIPRGVYYGRYLPLHSMVVPIAIDRQSRWSVKARLPGKDNKKTGGADFLVEVNDGRSADDQWIADRSPTPDLAHFCEDLGAKMDARERYEEFVRDELLPSIVRIVAEGQDPFRESTFGTRLRLPGLRVRPLLVAIQALGLLEHRRYPYKEREGGGRYLLTSFIAGVIHRTWSAGDVRVVLPEGIRGLRELRGHGDREPEFGEILGRPLRWIP